ncbi:MAG: D-aminoacylase [Candidatus Marinimicrobia bacterium]|nr:D-aminoacylase [Candidatus Neomarinimicrobiota bacterium]MDD5583055.1 D-aminoacylase [Candidatus Neomarinimicrobiota bacterium]
MKEEKGRWTRRDFIKTSVVMIGGLSLGCSIRSRFDVLIKNVQIADGSGSSLFPGDIGIRDGKIVAVGSLKNASAHYVLNGQGLVAAPGFVDIHSHTDLELLVNPHAEGKIRQGITTEVSGNCGSSPFPLTESDKKDLQKTLDEKYGLTESWDTLDGFFERLEKQGISVNYMTLTGHGTLRNAVMGAYDRPPTPDEIKKMKQILVETLEMGSLGLSTGLEYAPGSYAKTDELIELCKTVSHNDGLYATHLRNEDDRVEEAVEEALNISRESGVSLQISHLKACNKNNWHKIDALLDMIQNARQDGLPVHADRYPYNAWSTGLLTFLPLSARQGSREEIMSKLSKRENEEEVRKYILGRGQRIGGWDRVLINACRGEEGKIYEGKTLLEISQMLDLSPYETVRKLLIDFSGEVSTIGFAMDEENLKKVLKANFVSIGSDGSVSATYGPLFTGKPHPRCYGSFPRVLAVYVREEKVLTIPEAIHKMSAQNALKVGLTDRGFIRENYIADIVLFNPETVQDKATYLNPHQYPEGIPHVFVHGVPVIKEGNHTGKHPGKILRHKS